MEYMAKSQSGLYREYYSSNIIFCLYLDSGRVILSIAHGDCSLALMNCIQNLQELGGQLTSPSFFSICCRLLDTASKSLGSNMFLLKHVDLLGSWKSGCNVNICLMGNGNYSSLSACPEGNK